MTTTRTRKPRPCAAVHVGCTCAGNVVQHNLQTVRADPLT